MKQFSTMKYADGLRGQGIKGLREFEIRNAEGEQRKPKFLPTICGLGVPAVQSVFLAAERRFFSAFRIPLSAFEPTRFAAWAMIFFLTAVNLSAQRLNISDANSQSPNEPGFDLRLALGGTVNSDMSVAQRDNRDYPQTNINPLFATSVPFSGTISYESIGFNPGFRFDFAPGYRLNQWINFEFETGCIYNTVESYTITGNGTFTGVGGNPNLNGTMKLDAEGYLIQVPLMVNVEFSYPIGDGWRPFIGAGGGGMFQKLTVSTISGTINYQGDFNQSNFMGAWEAFLGCGYQVAPGFDVSIAYRLDGVLSPDFGGYTMQNFFTQAAEFEMNWRF